MKNDPLSDIPAMKRPSFLIASNGAVPSIEQKPASENPFKVGDILHSKTGYEAAISEFHKVVKVSGKNVWIVELEQHRKYENGGMDWVSTPNLNTPVDAKSGTRRLVKGGKYVKINSFRTAWLWNGEPSHDYNYH
jgi:hypothetical protein